MMNKWGSHLSPLKDCSGTPLIVSEDQFLLLHGLWVTMGTLILQLCHLLLSALWAQEASGAYV